MFIKLCFSLKSYHIIHIICDRKDASNPFLTLLPKFTTVAILQKLYLIQLKESQKYIFQVTKYTKIAADTLYFFSVAKCNQRLYTLRLRVSVQVTLTSTSFYYRLRLFILIADLISLRNMAIDF